MKKDKKMAPKGGKKKDEKPKNPFYGMDFEGAVNKALTTPLPKKNKK